MHLFCLKFIQKHQKTLMKSVRCILTKNVKDFGLVRVFEINRIHHWCSVGTEKSQPEGWDFSGTTEHQ